MIHFPRSHSGSASFSPSSRRPGTPTTRPAHAIELAGEEPGQAAPVMAAMVNPVGGGAEVESAILLNPTPKAIDLAGWKIADQQKRKCPLAGKLPAGGVLTVRLTAPTQLGNSGGIITLLDPGGLKVDGVSYTREQAKREGWLVVF